MTEIKSTPNPDTICHCSGTTANQIRQLVDEGITNLERLSRITGACSGCGGCEAELLALLAEYTTKD